MPRILIKYLLASSSLYFGILKHIFVWTNDCEIYFKILWVSSSTLRSGLMPYIYFNIRIEILLHDSVYKNITIKIL